MARMVVTIPPVHLPAEDAFGLVAVAAWGFLAAGAAFALLAPPLFWLSLAGTAALAVAFLAFRNTGACCAVWLLIAGSTPEMAIGDMIGPAAPQAIIKALSIVDDHFGFNRVLATLRQRMSFQILARRGELPRLIAWYSR